MSDKKWVRIEDIFFEKLEGTKQSVRGWIYRTRSSGNIVFLIIRDATGVLQVTAKKEILSDTEFDNAKKALVESSIKVTGVLQKDVRAPQGFELEASELEIVDYAEPFPITKDQSPEFLLDNRHLWLRSQKLTSILKIRSTVIYAIHQFFRKQGFFEFDAPVLQPNQCEGGSTLFEVKYYEDKTYLSQSWQLYAEAGIFSLEKIYNVGPTFRAERSKTSRHLSEFWMAEMEIAWADLSDILTFAENEIQFIVKEVLSHHQKELKDILNQDVDKLRRISQKKFPIITYSEALDILKNKEDMQIEWGKDLRTLEENTLMNHFDTPVIVTHYPTEIMAFYKPRDSNHPETALCFDMIAPEGYGEIIGGSQRSQDIDDMENRLKAMGENIDQYQWYFDLRRYGSVPHAGYGLGVERVVAWICGVDNIKDTIPFPRTLLRFRP